MLLCVGLSSVSFAATIVVNNLDATSGTGFDDPTVVAPVTGNPGTTLGAQRLIAFQAAADEWGATLVSVPTIVVDATMNALTVADNCAVNSATLGSAGPNSAFRDFVAAPVAATWFPGALRNALVGVDDDVSNAEISASFNRFVDDDSANCLSVYTWSYVIGAAPPPGTLAFTDTVLHEIGHGLGFLTFVDETTGASFAGFDDHFMRFLRDETSGLQWTTATMTDAERMASAINTGNLTWTGNEVGNVKSTLAAGRHGASDRVRMYAPNPVEPGSSVSHWDTVLSPDEVMEPSATPTSKQLLSNHQMLDIGWSAMLGLTIAKTDGLTTIVAGSATSYTITITNTGPGDVTAVNTSVTDNFPAALLGPTWSCSGTGGAVCGVASGTGNISTTVTVPLNGVITFTINATVDAGFTGTLSNTATLALPANITNTASNSASDSTTVTSTPGPGIDNELRNISTRADVRTGNDIAIAGFIISGTSQKCVVVRGRGPTVGVPVGVPRLPDPVLTLKSGQTTIAENDNWTVQANAGDENIILGLNLAPGDLLEAAIYTCLNPGPYTALLRGFLNTTGVGIIEVFDVDDGMPYLENISTRARVGTVHLVTIAGFIIAGNTSKQVLIRGRGPTVGVPVGVPRLGDPRLRLFDVNGVNFETNDNWQNAANAASVSATGLAPSNPRESAILITLQPGAYTAILDGATGGTGAGIVEVFDLTGR